MEMIFGFGVGLLFITGATILSLLALFFWVWMLIHCIQKNFKEPYMKLVWIILLLWLNVFGAVLYFFLEKDK